MLIDTDQASCELIAVFKVKQAVFYVNHTEEGEESDFFKAVILVSCEFSNVAR